MAGTEEPPPHDEIQLRLLGTPAWQRADSGGPLALRDAALLALLAVEGPVARDRAAAWLWPEADSDAKARLSLRQRLFRLRRECGHPLIEATLSLSLVPGVRVDLHTQPLPTEGVLLAGMDFTAFEAFDEWLRAARSALGARQADALAGQAAALEDRGALAEAIVLVERIVATWPATEHAWRRLMRLHWLRADRAAAVAAFERFEQQVCREWGLRPSSETLALLQTIESRDGSRPLPGASPSSLAPLSPLVPLSSVSTPSPLPAALLKPPRLVGRAAALAALAQAWNEGRASLVLAAGGMGKTRLLDDFVGGRPGVLRARARPGDSAQPYATLAHALDDALTRFAPELPGAAQAELTRLLTRLGPAPATPARPAALAAAVAQAWHACTRCGLLAVAWDDLHWADAATLELLHAQLAEPALASLRQVFAARPGESPEVDAALQQWLGDSLRVQPLRLPPWAEQDLVQLLPSLDLPGALAADPALPQRLLQQTGGQPFFVLETLKTLVLAGASGGGTPVTAPAIDAMVQRRVARLAEGPRRLLQLLAVAGSAQPLPLASAVLKREPIELAQDWAALADAQLVRDDGLVHDLVREALLAALPQPAVQAVHLALAQALARSSGVDPARLAAHWHAGQAWPEACAAWQQAAAAALRTGRVAEAQALFARASEAAGLSGDTAWQVAALAAAQPTRLLREGPDAVAASLQPLLEQVHDGAARARLLLLQAEAEMSRMQAAAADAAAAEALALCDALADSDEADALLLADATLMQGRTLAWTGRAEAGVRLLQAACERAEADGDLRRRLQAQATLADVLVAAGRRVESLQVQQGTLALARRLGDRFELAIAASNLAVYAMLVGQAREAEAAAGQALATFDAMGVEHVNRLMCAGVYAISAAHRGRFDSAQAAAAPLLHGPDGPVRRNLRNTLSTVALWRGQPEEAAALLPPLDDDSPLSVRVTGLFARLRWCAWTGHDDRAERTLLHAIGQAHPALRDDAHYYRSWAPFDPPEQALPRLDALATREAAAGAAANARSLALVAVQVALEVDPADAARRALALWPGFGLGLHPAVLPSVACCTLAQALRGAGHDTEAQQALGMARQWLAGVQLPDDGPQARQALLNGVPAHRRWLSAAAG